MSPHLNNGTFVEEIESRRLLSVTLLANDTLVLVGTDGADQFLIAQSSSQIAVAEVGVHPLLVFNADQVNVITASLLGGNDVLNAGLGFGAQLFPDLPQFGLLLKPFHVNAGNGNDTVYGGFAADTVNGGAGDDLVLNIFDADVIRGNDGNDKIFTEQGTETIYGDGGDDIVNVVSDSDNPFRNASIAGLVHGGEGNDHIRANGNGSFFGNADNDTIEGDLAAAGPDTYINGGAGDDVLSYPASPGPSGTDVGCTLIGGSGDDEISGDDGPDFIEAGEGDDFVDSRGGRDTVYGGEGVDIIFAGEGNDHVFGGSGNDRINGGAGSDELRGDAGNDFIQGGADDDDIFGGAGNDTLLGEGGVDILDGGPGTDVVIP
jgi:Ca2+-binding RTX toxin-like protein